jgi:general secretion pathway protein F
MKPLPHRIRADLFVQLSRLEHAGVAYDRAVAMMEVPEPAAKRLAAFQALAARGIDAARAGEQSGLFTPLETRLVRAALNAGSPAPTYQRLAEHHAQRAREASAIQSRLMMPALVLAIALVVQPLPALVSGAIGIAGYAWQVAWPVLAIAALVALVRALAGRIPLYRPIVVRASLRDFFESLALMLEAGVPMLDALAPAIETASDADVRRELKRAREKIQKGQPFSNAIADVPYLQAASVLALAHTGEQSGTLPQMLMRYADMESKAISHFYGQVAAWLPRIIYLLVAIKVALGISSGLAPRAPPQL